MWWGLVRHRRAPISYPAEFYDGYEFRRQPFPRHSAPTTAYPPADMPLYALGTDTRCQIFLELQYVREWLRY